VKTGWSNSKQGWQKGRLWLIKGCFSNDDDDDDDDVDSLSTDMERINLEPKF
jgi:hypothetical protein